MAAGATLPEVTGMILCGGLGTRLRQTLPDRQKTVADVGGRPFVSYLLAQLAGTGVRRAVLCVGYRADQVRESLGDVHAGVSLVYSREESPLGTGGALALGATLVDTPTVLALNGDSMVAADLAAFVGWQRARPFPLALIVREVPDTSRYGRVTVAPEGRVTGFVEKGGGAAPGWINAGVYLFPRDWLAGLAARGACSLERDVLPGCADGRLGAYRTTAPFLDIGTPESYARAAAFIAAHFPGAPPC